MKRLLDQNSSKKKYFDLAELNNRSRKRQLKRPTYIEFLEYIKDIDDSKNEYVDIELKPYQILADDMLNYQARIMTDRIVRDKYNVVEICKHLHGVDPRECVIVSKDYHYGIMRECSKISEEIRATIFDNLVNYLKNVDTKCIEKLITEDENVTSCKMFFGDVLEFVYLGYNGIYRRKFKTHPILTEMNDVK